MINKIIHSILLLTCCNLTYTYYFHEITSFTDRHSIVSFCVSLLLKYIYDWVIIPFCEAGLLKLPLSTQSKRLVKGGVYLYHTRIHARTHEHSHRHTERSRMSASFDVTGYKKFDRGHFLPKSMEHFLHFSKIMKLKNFFLKDHRFTEI